MVKTIGFEELTKTLNGAIDSGCSSKTKNGRIKLTEDQVSRIKGWSKTFNAKTFSTETFSVIVNKINGETYYLIVKEK